MSDMNSDPKTRDLEHELDEKEREIQMLRDSIHDFNSINPVSDERAKTIERRLDELESLVKGLTQEVLDVKACLKNISKSIGEDVPVHGHRGSGSGKGPGPKRYPPVVAPGAAADKRVAEVAEIEEEQPKRKEKLIMQPDGTMKKEIQSGDEMIIADNRPRQASSGRRSDPLERKPLIYAEEDDSIEIKRKNYKR